MPRPPRPQVEGGIYHISANGGIGRVLFRNDADVDYFLDVLGRVTARQRWSLRSYCVLNTHYHLLVETPHGDISAGMQSLNSRYAEWVNGSRNERGHVFRERYHAETIVADGHLFEVYRYIALNPVRAFVCERPENWRWSSYAQLLGIEQPLPFLDVVGALSDFAEAPDRARVRLQWFVNDPADVPVTAKTGRAA